MEYFCLIIHPFPALIKLISHEGTIDLVGGKLSIPNQGLKEGTLFIEINKNDLNSSKEKLK